TRLLMAVIRRFGMVDSSCSFAGAERRGSDFHYMTDGPFSERRLSTAYLSTGLNATDLPVIF
ncbi:MAG: hypothetical protein OEY61_08130, partial [Gammaproteobacteria bacterium]|nr:hypothetical protein [Gammaproteobacteria bacterium]